MEEMIARGWEGLMGRIGGPMTFRLIIQPLMATLLAVRAGLNDAREGRPAYFWTILTEPEHRMDLVREGWGSVARVFFLAVVMDLIYEWVVGRPYYPLETLIVAVCLAVLPYLLIRGPVNRLVRRRTQKVGAQQ